MRQQRNNKKGFSGNRSGGRSFGGNRRGGGGGGRSGFGGGSRSNFGGPREMHKTTCSECKQECEVPFKPTQGKPVYCKECYSKHKD
ncbi:DNA-directed RNA polymerase [Candidatus Pacearchaeota archaeon CG10_big_fil_rev_8_21_14_0_10_35_219]|nr:DNA-directed RNA polymerase [Candidatus Pacearchaeota archaeon]OIO42537.1 MAG: hypothetical protein AUJ63_02535 [Candidatus Pacearchaeota archaeon CG1_02_35_32]PIO07950.1 MAG: DNA-directed RNA polymerase [Candidatus Pacearchaeota archaeon CG10_big_fil_rev_8_21_14_0_10_35_219]PIY81405.1 MAG: DNA-directed RNA polymerase [Candidatus Pacearchaeota archaeon CG_4_10_14_0_8_um_filter_35_169]PIZ80631.1 MAG: DNA-directed RNA polymerase [Candidatus Pacearchaeota archaeon CG_4_10_14_0_2_um_filter_35_33